jgi:hypothetical protein
MVPAARFMAENDSSWRLSHKLNRHKASGIRGKIDGLWGPFNLGSTHPGGNSECGTGRKKQISSI